MIIGYARVSTASQSIVLQVEQLTAAGAEKVYSETVSGSHANRSELRKMLKAIKSGDTLVVVRLDRLARSTRDLLDIVGLIAESGAGFRSLSEPWADTTSPSGHMMLTVFAGFAEFERGLIAERTKAGRERAKQAGIKFGRNFALTDFQRREVLERLAAGESQRTLARSYNVSQATISRIYTDSDVGREAEHERKERARKSRELALAKLSREDRKALGL